MRHAYKFATCFLATALCFTSGCSASKGEHSSDKSLLDPEKPVSIEVWNYYNGAQQDAFNELITKFNEGDGKSLGIKVNSSSIGNVADLEKNVLASINGQVGAKEVPNIFAAYADTAYAVDLKDIVVDLSKYLTEDEIAEYMDSYIDEGRFSSEDSIKIFPIAKATEVFMLNKTDWDLFSEATGASLEDIETIEGVTKTAKEYYEWTDSLTEAPNDGKSFFGRDALANLFIVGAKQLGTEILSVKDGVPALDFHKETIRKIWDNYYVPYISGYFSATGKFRSDDIKTGNIISFVGSSSGATFFPKQVALDDNHLYDIEMMALTCPQFEGGKDYAVQQGAGMVVLDNENKAEIEASVEFLKWFTDVNQNIKFSIESGYLPVKEEANSETLIKQHIDNKDTYAIKVLDVALEQIQTSNLYTTRAFKNTSSLRDILEYSLADKAAADRVSVQALMADGKTYKEAVGHYNTDDNFESWYQETLTQLKELISN